MALVAFDLDDTLFKEADYLHSAWRYIASAISTKYGLDRNALLNIMYESENAFDILHDFLQNKLGDIPENIGWMVSTYRTHFPDIKLNEESRSVIGRLTSRGDTLALITDGRSSTQSNKIKALGLDRYISPDNIYISEQVGESKIGGKAFRILDKRYKGELKYYVGDNPLKDFYWPRKLNWTAIMLKGDEYNIHSQELPADKSLHPTITIDRISQLNNILI